MVFILLGFGLFIAAIIAFILQDILSLWLCVILGLFSMSWGLKALKSKHQTQNPQTPLFNPKTDFQSEERTDYKHPEPIIFKAAGVTFDCMFNETYKKRQNVLIDSYQESDIVLLEEYTFKNAPAFALINRRLEADFGNVPIELVYKVKELSQKYNCFGIFNKIDYFVPDEDETGTKIIYYCEIELKWYPKNK